MLHLSHALRVRGLKRKQQNKTDAYDKSHALRVRGLKPAVRGQYSIPAASHALRVRGLKPKTRATNALRWSRTLYACVD